MRTNRVFVLLAVAGLGACSSGSPVEEAIRWSELPELPLATGGPFAGVAGGALIVAGGAHFPGQPAYDGGTKAWVDSTYVLAPGATDWSSAAPLPQPRGYGASFTVPEGLVVAAGSDADSHSAEVLLLSWAEGGLETERLPDLPHPVANTGGAVLGRTLYLAGGQRSPDATTGLRTFWALDLDRPELGWRELEPWPGPGRILPVVTAQEGSVFVMSGAELLAGANGETTRRFLSDAYRYTPASGWQRIPDLPHPAVAAPAAPHGPSHVLVFGGDTGEHFERQAELRDSHPGFSREVLAYHTVTERWVTLGYLPEAGTVTTSAVPYQGGIVIPTGEDRPSHRIPRVLFGGSAPHEAQLISVDFIVLGVYLLGLVVLGLHFARRKTSTEDFFLAGRRIPWWAAGLSIYATQLSAITFMAIPAKAYATDWVFFLANWGILLVAPVVVFFYLPFFQRLRLSTAYEYLELRFNLAVRWFGSISFMLFQLGRMGIVVALPAMALSAVTGMSLVTSILLIGAVTTLYSALGGIEAVIWTDVLQAVVLLGAALVSLVLMTAHIGGFGELIAAGSAAGKLRMVQWTGDHTTTAIWVILVGNFLSNLIPYTTDQAVVQRYMTTPDEKAGARAVWTNALLAIPGTALFFAVGTALFVFYQQNPVNLSPTLDTDAIFPWFIARELPAGLSGLVIAAVFAAAMSSLDSSINSVSNVVMSDFYRRLRPQASEGAALRLARWLTIGLGTLATVTALLIASLNLASLWDAFLAITGLVGGPLAGLFALGIFTRRAHAAGALVGAFAGAAAVLAVQRNTDVHFFLYAGVGICTCFVLGYLASLLLPSAGRVPPGLTLHTMDEAAPHAATRHGAAASRSFDPVVS